MTCNLPCFRVFENKIKIVEAGMSIEKEAGEKMENSLIEDVRDD